MENKTDLEIMVDLARKIAEDRDQALDDAKFWRLEANNRELQLKKELSIMRTEIGRLTQIIDDVKISVE